MVRLMDELPAVRYAKSGDVYIAYRQFGVEGGPDVVLSAGATADMGPFWNCGAVAALGELARVTWYDKRGVGLSDGVANFTFEERMDDIRAVMDDAGIERAHLGGASEGGPMSILFAATYPDRVASMTLYGTFPSWMRRADYPGGLDMTLTEYGQYVDKFVQTALGDPEALRWAWELSAPSVAADPELLEQAAATRTVSPAATRLIWEHLYEVDVRSVLPSIQVPTTIVHKTGDRLVPVAGGRYLAAHIPGAKLVEIPGVDHALIEPCPEWTDAVLDNVSLSSAEHSDETERRLATVLFTDIVDSTPAATAAGDRTWSQLLDRHDSTSLGIIGEHQGRLVKTTGDGVLATFDGPSRAVRCAAGLHDAMVGLGIPIRAGLHTGEIEIRGDDIAGLAVHIASRVAGLAGAGETLVSSTVKDLVVGSGFEFHDQGEQRLKGIDGAWRCYALAGSSEPVARPS